MMNDGETLSRRHGVGRPHAVKEKGRWRRSRMVKQNRSQTVAQLTAQYNAGSSRIVSKHTVQRTLLDMGLRSKCPTRVPLLTKYHHQLL
ncbi:transposase domain containing protein [Trichonephila clavipes]|nr:transposase domain containing protein [Trichonephila clavipes]